MLQSMAVQLPAEIFLQRFQEEFANRDFSIIAKALAPAFGVADHNTWYKEFESLPVGSFERVSCAQKIVTNVKLHFRESLDELTQRLRREGDELLVAKIRRVTLP